jgi:hypothetical protein
MANHSVETIFLRYLLYPFLAIILVAVYAVLRKKNALLENRKVIVFVLLSALIIGVPGIIGLLGYSFSSTFFFVYQLLYLALGILYMRAMLRHISTKLTKFRVLVEVIISLTAVALGMYVFSLLYNMFSPMKNGLLVATSVLPLLVPLLFYWSYQAFLDIPPEIYKIWKYVAGKEELDLDGIDFNRMMVLEVEFSRNAEDEDLLKVKAKAPANVVYGDWFQKFINDYNNKFSGNPIAYSDRNSETYGWIFYVKPGFFSQRRYIDPELSVADNKIHEHKTIVCKRVMQF